MRYNPIALSVNQVSKFYKLYSNANDRLKESFHPLRKIYHHKHFALKNISFEVSKGETVGILGKNGSGKSTLLKIITGILTPSEGTVHVEGKISALLELGAGFNPMLSGIENIYLNGSILGYTKKEMDTKLDEILDFAEIGEFVYQPVNTYSSGMFVRLAFAFAICVDPDILIIDEALSVGDLRFQQKCFRKIEEFRGKKTILFVSHDLAAINKFCDRCIWLDDGELMDDGHPYEISKKYKAFMSQSDIANINPNEFNKNSKIIYQSMQIPPVANGLEMFGDHRAKITGLGIWSQKTSNWSTILTPKEQVRLYFQLEYREPITNPIVGFVIKDRLGNVIITTNSYIIGSQFQLTNCQNPATVYFDFTIPNLNNGYYTISPAIASGTQEDHIQHCWIHDAIIFEVISENRIQLEGVIFLDEIEFKVFSS